MERGCGRFLGLTKLLIRVGGADIKLDSYRTLKGAFMYSKQQKEAALKLYKQSKSVSETVRNLGYPTRKQLYNWIYEEKIHPKCARN
jgi:hypothetical protein